MNCDCEMDHQLLMNNATLKSLLKLEDNYVINSSYFDKSYRQTNKINQNEINEEMRQTLATWMLEVCEEQQLTDQIFSLSINLFDRLMCVMNNVQKYHLQLLGIVCLFIAAKLKSVKENKLNAVMLIEYTDHSVSLDEMLEWESIVLDKLRWDVASIVANDFVEIFLHKLVQNNQMFLTSNDLFVLRKHTYAFTALCSTDFKFSFYPSSMLAASCLLTALDGLNSDSTRQQEIEHLKSQLCSILYTEANIDIECVLQLRELVDDLFRQSSSNESVEHEQQIDIEQQQMYSNTILSHIQFEDDFDFIPEYAEQPFDFIEADNSSDNLSYDQLMCVLNKNTNLLNLNEVMQMSEECQRVTRSKSKRHGQQEINKENREFFKSRSSSSSSFNSSASSGVSSTMTNYLLSNISPPLANTLPMPTF